MLQAKSREGLTFGEHWPDIKSLGLSHEQAPQKEEARRLCIAFRRPPLAVLPQCAGGDEALSWPLNARHHFRFQALLLCGLWACIYSRQPLQKMEAIPTESETLRNCLTSNTGYPDRARQLGASLPGPRAWRESTALVKFRDDSGSTPRATSNLADSGQSVITRTGRYADANRRSGTQLISQNSGSPASAGDRGSNLAISRQAAQKARSRVPFGGHFIEESLRPDSPEAVLYLEGIHELRKKGASR